MASGDLVSHCGRILWSYPMYDCLALCKTTRELANLYGLLERATDLRQICEHYMLGKMVDAEGDMRHTG